MGTSPKPQNPNSITTQEFNSFHSIDRQLFTRLVSGLGRDPAESAHVIALWLWLERYGHVGNLVYKALNSLPNPLLDAMAAESVSVLICIRNPYWSLNNVADIPVLRDMSSSGVTLMFFYANRGEIARGVTKLVRDVCARAFEDLRFGNVGKGGGDVPLYWHPVMNEINLYHLRGGCVADQERASDREEMNNEREEVLRGLNHLSASDLEEGAVPVVHPKDRSIFLTFSKSYPVSEDEVRKFFTRKFGEIIDEIDMDKESLYARLVLHSAASIPVVLGGRSSVEFIINGREVRARKYVPKK